MQRRRCVERAAGRARLFAPLLVALACAAAADAPAQEAPAADPRDMVALAPPRRLQLEVVVNGKPTNLIIPFVERPDGTLAAPRRELADVHIRAPGAGDAAELVALDRIPGLTYDYDKSAQTVRVTIPLEQMTERVYGGAAAESDKGQRPIGEAGFGGLVNYNLRSSLMKDFRGGLDYQGASATLDARLFSEYGTLKSGAIVGSTVIKRMDALRLDTTYNYADPNSLMNYNVGDVIASGPSWSRPIRLGGLQAQKNFALRPDLVTAALPSISGSAAVPTTAEVYVNNQLSIAQQIEDGPYRIAPAHVAGDGTLRVQTRDASGRIIQTERPFYISSKILAPGMFDWSVEAGLPRQYYAAQSSTYSKTAVGSASFRGGLMDWLTLEAHGETSTSRLFNGSLGANIRLFDRAVATIAGGGSFYGGRAGAIGYFGLDTRLYGVGISFATQRAFGEYNDLAAVTAPRFNPYNFALAATNAGFYTSYFNSLRPPRALDRISLSSQLPFDPMATATISFVNIDQGPDLISSRMVNLALSRTFFDDVTAYLSASYDIRNPLQRSIFAGLSVPFGGGVTASASFTPRNDRGGVAVLVDAGHPIGQEPGSLGWRVRSTGMRGSDDYREAAAGYRHEYGRIEAGLSQLNRRVGGYAEAEGAVAGALGGGVGLSNRINDSFAVVKAGAPGVGVFSENRPAGKTNMFGALIVPNLRAYEKNHLSLDVKDLPVDAHVAESERVVRPARGAGVVVDFAGKPRVNGAIVIVRNAKGDFIAAGARVELEGSGERFVVGYDGRIWMTNLAGDNRITVATGLASCAASFPYDPARGRRQTIGPLVCE